MIEIPYLANSDGYSAQPGLGTSIVTDLPGGMPRYEKDFVDSYFTFQVNFELKRDQYENLCALYEQYLQNPQPVRVLNLSSYGVAKPHLCFISPGSWKLEATNALDYFKVSMRMMGNEE